LSILNGSFINGSFRNVAVPVTQMPINTSQFAAGLIAYNTNSLTEKYGFISNAQVQMLSTNGDGGYVEYSPAEYIGNFAYINNNPIASNEAVTNFYNVYTSPTSQLISLSAVSEVGGPIARSIPYGGAQPFIMEFTGGTPPTNALSGVAFQAPSNFSVINDVNQFDQGNFIIRADLFSGNNYIEKQTAILPFNVVNNNSQIVIVFDAVSGLLNIYNNAELIQTIALSANTFYTSYYLNNNFGVGMPFINNKAASTIGENYADYPSNYSFNNFVVYNSALDPDEVKFNYLQNQTINSINFDITSGTRNNTDTVTSFNKMSIPGRKNNNTIIYIKNAYLDAAGQANLTAQLLPKIRNVIPLNVNNVEIQYIDYNTLPVYSS